MFALRHPSFAPFLVVAGRIIVTGEGPVLVILYHSTVWDAHFHHNHSDDDRCYAFFRCCWYNKWYNFIETVRSHSMHRSNDSVACSNMCICQVILKGVSIRWRRRFHFYISQIEMNLHDGTKYPWIIWIKIHTLMIYWIKFRFRRYSDRAKKRSLFTVVLHGRAEILVLNQLFSLTWNFSEKPTSHFSHLYCVLGVCFGCKCVCLCATVVFSLEIYGW